MKLPKNNDKKNDTRNDSMESLRVSEVRYRRLFEAAKDGILILNVATGRITDANPFIGKLLGISRAELVGKELWQLGFFKDKKASKIAMKELQEKHYIRYDDLPLETKGGLQIDVEFVSNVYREGSHDVIQCNIRNITERKRGEREQIASRKKLEEALRFKDEFIGIASHELKTPVTSVKAYTQILQNRFRKEKDEKSAELVDKMDAQLGKLTHLIDDLLDITKIDAGRLQFRESYFNFNELAKEIIEELHRTTGNHTFITEFAKETTVYGDRDRIGQVLTNFITNAIKYAPHADKIVIKTIMNKKNMMLCVQDFGGGILKKDRTKIFERFYRVGGSKKNTYPGLGLGLYVASEIIKRHGGSIWVESEKKKGSTFCFSVPIKKPQQVL